MHDPMVVAAEIRRPWPKVSRARHHRWRMTRLFWDLGFVELYWPALVTIWHVEPDDQDSGTVCKPGTWLKHPHHWRFQFHPWQHFRRWAFTRCAWCGGKSRKGDYVNTGYGWSGDREPAHWWESEIGLFHHDCIGIEHAHRTCICSLADGGPWATNGFNGPHGECQTCGGFRRMPLEKDTAPGGDYDVRVRTTELMRAIPRGERNPQVTAEVERLWKAHRSTEQES